MVLKMLVTFYCMSDRCIVVQFHKIDFPGEGVTTAVYLIKNLEITNFCFA